MTEPRHPVYVISKGRAGHVITLRWLIADETPFKLVVEPQEADAYAKAYGRDRLLVLPFSNLGQGSIPARNWVWEHAKTSGAERHWILDDNIFCLRRLYRGHRIPCSSRLAFAALEEFTDRYENLAILGLNYQAFVPNATPAPFYLNVHVYSCMLILNSLPFRWRGRYNEDTDLCLQVLSAGWCTVLVNAFMINKAKTMLMKGGNTDELYKGDGRLRMARSLERMWPGVVEVRRRFDRPQHFIRRNWRGFDTPLRKKPGVVLPADAEHGMTLAVKAPIKNPSLRKLMDDHRGPR